MSRRRKILVFAPCALALVIITSAGTTAWAGGIKLRVTAEQANIREKPDIMSAILQQLPEGATLEAERKEGEWYAVLVEKEGGGSIIGYVHESLVMVIAEAPQEKRPRRERVEEQESAVARPSEEKKEEPRKRERMGLVLWLGGRYAAVGDLNDGAAGLGRYYESRLSASSDGEIKELHFGYIFGAEVRIPLAAGFYFSLGAERSSAEASSSVAFKGGSLEASYLTKPWLQITPVNLALVFYPLRFIYARAGLDYTLARCAYFYRLSYPDPYEQSEFWQAWRGEASSSGFGYLLGLGLELSLGSFASLIAEGLYRHGRLDDFEGEDFYQESTSYQSREEGTLYRISASAGGQETYPLVFIRNRKPTEAGVMNVRKAELDLSGYSLKLGLKVRF